MDDHFLLELVMTMVRWKIDDKNLVLEMQNA